MPMAHKIGSRTASLGFLFFAFLIAVWTIPMKSPRSLPPSYPTTSPAASPQLLDAYAKLPLSFEVNRGQAGPGIQFLSRGHGLALSLGSGDAAILIDQKDSRAPRREVSLESAEYGSALFSLLSGTPANEPAVNELQPASPAATRLLRMSLLGARPGLQGIGVDQLPGKANYFIGDDPKNWQTNLETYAKVKYEGIYPGIDLLYYGNQQRLEYDFVVAPGSSPKQIQLAFEGVDHARIDPTSGDLVLDSGGAEVRFQKPSIYQINEASSTGGIVSKHFVDGDYTLEADNRIGFNVAAYDSSRPLVIDPVLSFFTYLGGMLPDVALHVAADATGVYVTGATTSPDFPTGSAFSSSFHAAICGQSQYPSFPCPDAFVTKLKPDGSGILYSTYLGGSRSDIGIGIAVDSSQQAYIVGETESMDFPTTNSGFQNSATSRLTRAFLTKLSSGGSQLLYSTYLGGTPGSRGAGFNDDVNDTFATAVAVDNAGHAYLSGYTRSNSLPTTPSVVQPNAGGNSGAGGVQCHNADGFLLPCSDGFVAKFDTKASGSVSLLYATYLGGSYYDATTGIAIDSGGNAYVVGATLSDDFPVVAAFQASRKAGRCGPFASFGGGGHVCASAFVAKLNPTATALVYSSYLGGTGDTAAAGVAVDSSGNAYLTGTTNAGDFPATAGVAQRSLATATCSLAGYSVTCPDAFVAKVSSAGLLSYATFLGGSGADVGFGIAVDSTGNAYVAGVTNSTNFPTASAVQATLSSGTCTIRISYVSYNLNCPDAFLTELDHAGATLVYSTYLGGSNADFATGVALDASNNVYVAGGTLSPGLATSGAFQTMLGSKGDAFVFKVAASAAAPPTFTLVPTATGGSTSATVKAGQTATYNLQINPTGGFTGTVSFTCPGAPAQATCNPPSPVSVTGTAAMPFTVTVNTAAASAVTPVPWRIPNTRVPVWPFAFLLLVVLVLVSRNRLGFPKWRTPFLWATALFFVSLLLLVGCSSGQKSTQNPGTPVGNYTLTLTGTSGSVTQNLSLTLTVQ
jgi:beta-propeller repeat-containing protein